MILDANGMPVLQPTVDNASTGTFNVAFAAIGTEIRGRYRYFRGTSSERATWATSGNVEPYDHWQDTNGDGFEYIRIGSAWVAVGGFVTGNIQYASGISYTDGQFLRRHASGEVHLCYKGTYSPGLGDGSNIGTIPSGFRPASQLALPVALNGGTVGPRNGTVVLSAAGALVIYGTGSTAPEQVSFTAVYSI